MATAKQEEERRKKPPKTRPEPALMPAPGRLLDEPSSGLLGRRSRLNQWITLALVMMALAVVYGFTRDVLYRRVIRQLAQDTLNSFATGSVEKMDHVGLTSEGNVRIRGGVVSHIQRGKRRVFYRADRIEIALDGFPLGEETVYVSRVDLFHPEIWVVREKGGDWNIVSAFQAVPADPDAPPPPPPPPPPPTVGVPVPAHPARGGFPRNGVHIHDGTIHVVFARDDGSDLVLDITRVNTTITRAPTGIRFGPMRATFYGGEMRADATIPSYEPFRMDLQLSVRGADVTKLAEGRPFIKRTPYGKLDAVLALTADSQAIGDRPICAGRIDIRDGDLWDLPAFVCVLASLSLTEVGDRKLTAAQLEFTVERDRVRIDRMNFLGKPLNLFGDGSMALTGEDLDITLVPRIGKGWDEVLPLVGIPIQLLLDVIKGAIVPVRIRGTFWAPQFLVGDSEVSAPVKKMIEEKEKR